MKFECSVAWAAFALVAAVSSGRGENPAASSGGPGVTPASALAPAKREFVRFSHQPTKVGDRAVQDVDVRMTIATQIIQSGQIANESTDSLHRQQRRVIDVREVSEGRATKIHASFPMSRRQSPQEGDGETLAVQPIEGKSYVMIREGEELRITDPSGAMPPLEEYKLVREALDNVGKPNPLATLLVGRRVAVGEKILVPRDVVKQLLGLADQIGTVKRFELTLAGVAPSRDAQASGAARTATFVARLEISPSGSSPMAMTLDGRLVVDVDSCRVQRTDFTGPIDMSSIERTPEGIFQYSAGGDLAISTRSQYGRSSGE